jgi:hypothetical protein
VTLIEFREAVRVTLHQALEGLTWRELKRAAALPYERPCPTWVKRLEADIGLQRVKGPTRALRWTLPSREVQ